MTEKKSPLPYERQILALENELNKHDDRERIEAVFIEHCNSFFLSYLISENLIEISNDKDYVAPHVSGKSSLRIINNEKYTYSVQLYFPVKKAQARTIWTGNSHDSVQSQTVWTGSRQILFIKGPGTCKIRFLQIPQEININDFKPGVKLSIVGEKLLQAGDSVTNWDSHKIIEIIEVYEPVCIESLNINDSDVELGWTFDSDLRSAGAASSQLFLTRLMTILNLAIEMDTGIPDQLYKSIFNAGDPFLKFRAIEAMLIESHDEALDYLQMALESPDPILSDLAEKLFNKLLLINK